MNDFTNVATLIKLQLKNLSQDSVHYVAVEPFGNSRLLICKKSSELIIRIYNDVEVRAYPTWFSFDESEDWVELSCDYSEYLPEVMYLFCHCWREMGKFSHPILEDIILKSLEDLKLRWEGGKEPLTREQQKGLIGELQAVKFSVEQCGQIAINGWDETSHALQDIQTERWIVEAKSKSPSSDKVQISSFAQLEHDTQINMFLSVTDISHNVSHGITLPTYCNQFLKELEDVNCAGVSILRTKLESLGICQTNLFKTKFEVLDTILYKIKLGGSPDQMAKNILPEGVNCGGYKLSLGVLNESSFDKLLLM